jgi:diguanylate cyclase (GGDEF)-like protein
LYLLAVAIGAAAAAAPFLSRLDAETPGWTTFLILAGAASLAQLLVVVTSCNTSYYVTGVVLLPAALLLPPEFVALIALVQHIPEWLKERYAWYIQTFNICNYTLAVLGAWATAQAVLALPGPDARLSFALAGTAAAIVFVGINHVLIAPMLKLARGHSIRELGVFSFESLSTDLVTAALGVVATIVWLANPWLIAFAALPLLLIHRSLSVPKLQEQARIDPKTGLFNAGHFGEVLVNEIARSERLGRPLSLIMADLDLLRDINNTYGHLAGDSVLAGVAEVFRKELRHYDVPARFGGEEFAILLPETPPEHALEIAERIRRAVSERGFDVDTAGEPVRVTVSLGVSAFPQDGSDPSALVHQADLAVYRAKLQGRNRVVAANGEVVPQEIVLPPERRSRLASVPEELVAASPTLGVKVANELRHSRRHLARGPRFLALSWGTTVLVTVVGLAGVAAALAGAVLDFPPDVSGLLAIAALVGLGQALAVEYEEGAGSVSVGAVGVLAGAAMFGFGGALVLAAVSVLVDWSARRAPLHRTLYNFATVSLASVAAAGVFSLGIDGPRPSVATVLGLVAGAAYFLVNTALVSSAVAVEGHERPWRVWNESFRWLLPHYVLYGFVGAVMAVAYQAAGLYALIVFAVPVVLMRRAQVAYLAHTQRNAQQLRSAAETIQAQNVSLEEANRLLKERSTAAMASLSAMVDARDSYTAGHSRRVRRIALAIGAELGLSQAELDILGHAAHFHDVGKIAVPDAVLLKSDALTIEEWKLMKDHAEAGARIIARLGFLADAVPAIRHHHERFDGRGYPDGLVGEDIPLGARIIHVADAMDSMMTTRTYRAALSFAEALAELRAGTGTQFCPRSVAGLDRGLTSSSLFRLERVA